MTAIVPDTLQGAVVLSVIDFFASFVIIAGIGLVLAAFPLVMRLVERLQRKPAAPPRPAAAAPKAAPAIAGVPPEHVAAITAAVYAMLGRQRIVRIEDARDGSGWSAEGRAAHHSSHSRLLTR